MVDPTDGLTSLREAIGFVNDGTFAAGSTISFASGAGEAFEGGGEIDLALGQLVITASMTIDGDLDDDGTPDVTIDAQGASRVIYVVTGTSNFKGLILTGGRVPSMFDFGGGLRVDPGVTVTVSDSVIRGNHSVGIGGGVVSAGALTLIRTEVSGNSADGAGGGVLGQIGGTVSLIDTTVSGNTAGSGGGGLTLDGDATLTNVTVANNSANFGGGILSSGVLTATHTTISGNTAGDGGGLWMNGETTLTNVTVADNSAGNASGGILSAGVLTAIHTTITGNTAFFGGAGLRAFGHETLVNTLIVGNASEDGDVSGTIESQTATLNGGDPAAVFAALGASGGGLLADNGGPVQTVALRADAVNPALDASDPATATPTDARGVAAVDAPGVGAESGAGIRDLGAFELFALPTTAAANFNVPLAGGVVDLATLSGAAPTGGSFSGNGVDGASGTFDPQDSPPVQWRPLPTPSPIPSA